MSKTTVDTESTLGLIDSHAHLTYPGLCEDLDGVLLRGANAGVDQVITVGTDYSDVHAAILLADRFAGRVRVAAGFHPHKVGDVTDSDWSAMVESWRHPAVVAVGEIGLDYHYDFADRGLQREMLARQLRAAQKLPHPLVIHCREAVADTVSLLKDHGYAHRPVVFHCFTGHAEEAALLAEHGWRISFTGIVTFRNSTGLQAIARMYPADRLMIETDSPYLSPVPVRGRVPNEPAHIVHVARFLAELRGVTLETLAEQTAANTRLFFGL